MARRLHDPTENFLTGQMLRAWTISALVHCIVLLAMTLTWWAARSAGLIPALKVGMTAATIEQPLVVLEAERESDAPASLEFDDSLIAGGGDFADGDGGVFGEAGSSGAGSGANSGFGNGGLPGLGLNLVGGENGVQFYGVKAQGKGFVFVVDCSGSMEGERFYRALEELRNSLLSLRQAQAFFVYFYSDEEYPMPAEGLLKADAINRRRIFRWIQKAKANGGTNPLGALKNALELRPDAIFFLTDGEFDDDVIDAIAQPDGSTKIPIHSICIDSEQGANLLKTIAEQSGGTFRFVR